MNTNSNAQTDTLSGARIDSQAAASSLSVPRQFAWSLRRELWENRYIYLAPLTVGAFTLFVFSLTIVHVVRKMHAEMALDPDKMHGALAAPYDTVAALFMAVQMLVGIFYCLDALYGERRDRSILFWKSLPVSDTITVLSKATIPIIIIPLLTSALCVVTLWIMLFINSAAFSVTGYSVSWLWSQLRLPEMSVLIVYHLLTVHALWHAPIYAWFLLVSAWAKRAPFLWAFLPPIAIAALEKVMFNTTHFLGLLGYRLAGGPEGASGMDFPIHPGIHLTPLRFLFSSGLLDGFIFTAICLAIAIRLRRYRGPV